MPPAPPQAAVRDTAGTALEFTGEDGQFAQLRCPNGTLLSVPLALLSEQDDGSLRLPFAVHCTGEAAALSMPVLEERLQLGKRSVDTGGVRIDKSVELHDDQADVTLASEQVEVERIPVGVEVREDDLPRMREEGDTVVIPVLEERLVVRKQVVLKEELRIRRKRTERRETIAETLRREQVDVVRLEGSAGERKKPG